MSGRSVLVTAIVGLCATAVGLSATAVVDPTLTGKKLCNLTERLPLRTKDSNHSSILQHLAYTCLEHFKTKCHKNLDNFEFDNMEVPIHNITMFKCCAGYEPTEDGAECQLACEKENNSSCTPPKDCVCTYAIDTPDGNGSATDSPSEDHGLDCLKTCPCRNNVTCGSRDGVDHNSLEPCDNGFTAAECDSPCPSEFDSDEFINKCDCNSNSTCQIETGECICKPGYSGKHCDTPCQPGYYGINCMHHCDCENGGTCDPITGERCKTHCPPGFYGRQCNEICDCKFGAVCDETHGCLCRGGEHLRKYCIIKNMRHLSVNNSKDFCNCDWYKNEDCHLSTGKCVCKYTLKGVCVCQPGFTGSKCNIPCPKGSYGLNCSSVCDCYNEAICRASDGICLCAPGYYGPTCSEACPQNYYGDVCLHKCSCDQERETCDHILGCVFNISNQNKRWIQMELENEIISSWVFFDISVILTFMVMSMLCAGLLVCYYYYYSYQILKANQRYRHGFELQENSIIDGQVVNFGTNRDSGLPIRPTNDPVFNMGQNMSYTNEMFYSEHSSFSHLSFENKEHVYLEIDENFFKQRQDDLYDHLDFLRPTGSWKPHYQKALVSPEHSRSSSNAEVDTT